jgi:H+/Cl- antiporter ClcA
MADEEPSATTAPKPHAALHEAPATLGHPAALRFWLAVIAVGVGAGLSAGLLTRLLEVVQGWTWGAAPSAPLYDSVERAPAMRRLVALLGAGAITGVGQIVLSRLSSGNGIDVTEAILFRAGRLPRLRTLASALLSVIIVAMGASLGREGAPKQAGAVIADAACDHLRLSDDQRRLLVACGSGAGMAGAYGVPVGGALFAMEVMRGVLALRMVLPALVSSVLSAAVAWAFLPNTPTYSIDETPDSLSFRSFALVMGLLAGVVAVGYVRLITFADRAKPRGKFRVLAPVLGLGALGVAALRFPLILGNGKDMTQLAFVAALPPMTVLALFALKPVATALCLGCGAPGGLFTPSLSVGALFGAVLGYAWAALFPGAPVGSCAVVGATAMLAATTQGPLSAIVLMMELTGRDRAFVVPLILGAASATLVARSLEPRSIYDARLSDAQVRARRAGPGGAPALPPS